MLLAPRINYDVRKILRYLLPEPQQIIHGLPVRYTQSGVIVGLYESLSRDRLERLNMLVTQPYRDFKTHCIKSYISVVMSEVVVSHTELFLYKLIKIFVRYFYV